MKTDPITATLMTIQYLYAFNLNSNKRAEILSFRQFFTQNREIPNPNSRVKRARYYEIFLSMKLCAHDVVTMTCNNIDAGSTLIIPDAHGLIVTG